MVTPVVRNIDCVHITYHRGDHITCNESSVIKKTKQLFVSRHSDTGLHFSFATDFSTYAGTLEAECFFVR